MTTYHLGPFVGVANASLFQDFSTKINNEMWNTKTIVLCGNPSWRNISYHACGDYFLNFGMNCSPRSTDDPCWQKRRLETNDKLEMSALTEPDWRLTVQVEKVLKAVLVNTNLASGICIMHPQFSHLKFHPKSGHYFLQKKSWLSFCLISKIWLGVQKN